MASPEALVSSRFEFEGRSGLGRRYIQPPAGTQQLGKRRGLLRLAVHQKHPAQRRRQRLNPFEQLALIGVAAEFVQARNLRPDALRLAENPHLRPFLDQLAAEGILRLKSRDQNRISRVLNVVPEVVQDTSLLAHAGSRNHHERTVKIVEALRLLRLADVLQPAKTKRILAIRKVLARLF